MAWLGENVIFVHTYYFAMLLKNGKLHISFESWNPTRANFGLRIRLFGNRSRNIQIEKKIICKKIGHLWLPFRWSFHQRHSEGSPCDISGGCRLLLDQHVQLGPSGGSFRRLQSLRNRSGKWARRSGTLYPDKDRLRRNERCRLRTPLQRGLNTKDSNQPQKKTTPNQSLPWDTPLEIDLGHSTRLAVA